MIDFASHIDLKSTTWKRAHTHEDQHRWPPTSLIPCNKSNHMARVAAFPGREAPHRTHCCSLQPRPEVPQHPHPEPHVEHLVDDLGKERLPDPAGLPQVPPQPIAEALPDGELVAAQIGLPQQQLVAGPRRSRQQQLLSIGGLLCPSELHRWSGGWRAVKDESKLYI